MRRNRSVSVMIFNGMRLRIAIRNGRMSCEDARCSSMTKMFSDRNASTAGSDTGTLTGIISIYSENFRKDTK